MSTNPSHVPSSPSTSISLLPHGLRSRRDSLSSITSSPRVDKEQLGKALDAIHNTASQSESLTTFNEFASPPPAHTTGESKGLAGELMHNGLSGLYSRFKGAVAGSSSSKGSSPLTKDDGNALDGVPNKPKDGTPTPQSSLGAKERHIISNPPSVSSLPPSRLQSPTNSSFPASVDFKIQPQRLSKPAAIKLPAPVRANISPVTKAPPSSTVDPIHANAFNNSWSNDLPAPEDEPRISSQKSSTSPQHAGRSRDCSDVLDGSDSGRSQHRRRNDQSLPTRARGGSQADVATSDGSFDRRSQSPVLVRAEMSELSAKQAPERVLLKADGHQGRLSIADGKRVQPADKITQAHLPGYRTSRASSMERSLTETSPINTSAHNSVRHASFAIDSVLPRSSSGTERIPGTTQNQGAPEMVSSKLEQMRKQVLSKEFWMADEICKECFLCGDAFTAFRRKHHCRTCGCIFDSKCTKIVPGERFGVHGTLRVCKTCLDIINRRHDSSDDSADDEIMPTSFFHSQQGKSDLYEQSQGKEKVADINTSLAQAEPSSSRSLATPMMAIPAARRIADSSTRRSAVLEIDTPQLSRPSSSRSLKSMTGLRPPSSAHRRHQSKHHFLGRFRGTTEQRAPFHKDTGVERLQTKLPAFHDDNIIDPDLAPYMSDEGSSGDEQMSIFGALNGDSVTSPNYENERAAFGSLLSTGRRVRSRAGDKSVNGVSFVNRGMEDFGGSGLASPLARPSRKRNLSTSSNNFHHIRGSPRFVRPVSLVRGYSGWNDEPSNEQPVESSSPRGPSKMTRSVSMRDANAPAIELNAASLHHVKRLLQQLLQDAGIPNVSSWEKALIPILLRSTDDVNPDVRRGDSIDIRHYVKLKKIPGGKPGDTAYVSGIVFSKNLALKSMARSIANPRIVLISFPIEYQKHQQHFMSIEPVIAQEPDFLRNMVNRIISLRPHIVLVEKNISGLALQYLEEANVAVAYNVKPAVIEAVARFTQTEIISSIDMVALKPVHVGRSDSFDVKTYTHKDIPGRKKTYMQISGCQKELGCTIVLRGAPMSILSKMKRITEFMVYVVYNLKLETCLMRDEYILIPSINESGGDFSTGMPSKCGTTDSGCDGSTPRLGPTSLQLKLAAVAEASKKLQVLQKSEAEPQNSAETSLEMQSQDERAGLDSQQDLASGLPIEPEQPHIVFAHQHHTNEDHETAVPEDVPMPTFYSDMVAKHQTRILSASPFVKFMQPYLLTRAREQERRLVYLKRLRDQDSFEEQAESEKPRPQKFQLIHPEMVHETLTGAPKPIMEVLHAVHDAEYDKALHNYQRQKRQWEIYLQGNVDLFNPFAHQNIVVSYTVVCTATTVPCLGPDIIAMSFYNEQNNSLEWGPDCTLGQYVEDLCQGIDDVCQSNGCERKMSDHHRTYVHGEARITVILEIIPSKIKGLHESILMWSYCKICKKETQVMPMSESTWKYSFGKYLELSFWSSGVRLRGDSCPHDLHRDHIRFFGYHNVAMRVHHDPIDLLEIVVPRTRITWKVDTDLRMKNDLFTKTEERWNRFMMTVKSRIKGINIDSVVPEKAEACKGEVERLTRRAQDEHTSLLRKLQEKYTESKYYEIIPMNRAVRAMQEKVAEWDAAFADFDANYFPSEKDIRRLAALQLKKMFMDRDSSSTSLASTDVNDQLSDVDHEKVPEELKEPGSSLSDVKDVLQSVVEEENNPAHLETLTGTSNDGLSSSNDEMHAVSHLDLAIAKGAGSRSLLTDNTEPDNLYQKEPTTNQDEPVPFDESALPTPTLETPMPEFPPPDEAYDLTPVPSEASLSEKIFNLRRATQADADAKTAEASFRPNEKGTVRRAGSATSPPIIRTQSQPVSTLRRLPPITSKTYVGRGDGPKMPTPSEELLDPFRSLNMEPVKDRKLSDRLGLGTIKSGRKTGHSMIPRSIGGKRKETKVSNLAKHFEQLSREFEKERLRDRRQRAAKVTQSRAFPKASSKPIVEVYKDVNEAVEEYSPDDVTTVESLHTDTEQRTAVDDLADLVPSTDASTPHSPTGTMETAEETNTEETGDEQPSMSHPPSDDETAASDIDHSLLDDLPSVSDITESLGTSEPITDLDIPKHEKSSYLKMLTNFWAERSASGWTSLEYPLNATDHVFVDSDIIVREDEPSSLIAFALSSEDYVNKLKYIREQDQAGGIGRGVPQEGHMPFEDDCENGLDQAEVEKSLLRATGTHLKYQFAEGSAKMLCKIFYAEQFDAIRRSCGIGDRIIECLSRCAKWDSKGGKTKSVFLKTLDDRLVLKSLSPIETQAFLRFAPAYFNLMAEALFHDLPTVIAKMFGFYQIVIKNPVTGTEIKWDLLIMENLFYGRTACRTFDLKGSMRNRKIESTGEQNEVLLDENMVEYIYESPLFTREHSKKLLRVSVWNDTLFLARQNVMDYSLMVAVDEGRKELVVGIIDCIRTYTWDKKLETWIKDRGFVGGGRNRPTVTSPKEYKSRFREAMARYILQAPNCWHQFNDGRLEQVKLPRIDLRNDSADLDEPEA